MRSIKINTSGENRGKKVALLVALVLIAIGVGAVVYVKSNNDVPKGEINGVNYDPPSAEDKQEAEDQKIDKIENQSGAPAPQPTTNIVTITESSYEAASKSIVIKTRLDGSGWQSCTITASKAGSTDVVKTADVLYQSSFSTCLGFTIPAEELDSPGQWTLKLSATDGSNNTKASDPVSVMVDK